ncbi:MAG: hypothetical protein R6V25_09700 [Desulfatiglandales bacterium]
MDELLKVVSGMPPEKALSEITEIFRRLLEDMDSEARERFLMNLITKFEGDEVSSLVNL